MSFGGYCVSRRGYCVWEPWLVRLLSPCEGRVVKGVTSNGTKNTGETGAAFCMPRVCRGVRSRGRKAMSRRSVSDVLDAARAVGVGWDDVAGKTDGEVYALLFPGRGERESVYEQPDWARVHRELARVGVTLRILHGGIRGRMPTDRETPYGLRPVLQAVRRIRAEVGRDEQGGAQGRPHHRGRLGRQDLRIVDPVTGDSSTAYLFVAVLPFSRYAFVETHARHGAELVAAGPCGDVRVVRRFHAPPGVRQSEDRRHRASARGRGRVERRVPGFGRALLGRPCCPDGSGSRRTSPRRRTPYGTPRWRWPARCATTSSARWTSCGPR